MGQAFRRRFTAIGLTALVAALIASALATPAAAREPEPGPPARAAAAADALPCTRLVDIDLLSQRLVASECGQTFVTTPITSGRPDLRTPTGTYTIFLRQRDVYFYSPWPEGDPNYYPPMPVAYAIEFLDDGYFIHTDPDEPDGAYGPGSEDGPYASHGCVHVPYSAMASLYEWAVEGTRVDIHY